jgi:hypothetical protein
VNSTPGAPIDTTVSAGTSLPSPSPPSFLSLTPSRKIQEKDVEYTATPGHVGGYGAIVGRIGRGLVRSVSCGREYTIVATWPYEGPNFEVCTKLMEEQKVREEEANLIKQQNAGMVKYDDDSLN